MDEMVIAQIDANMGKSMTHGIEKHQIPGFKFMAANDITDLTLFSGSAWQ